MKKILSIAAVIIFCTEAFAQRSSYDTYNNLSGWFLEGNFTLGSVSQNINQNIFTSNYANVLNATMDSQMKFNSGASYGFELQVGHFFAPKRNFGIALGLNWYNQTGNISLKNNFHVEFQSTDQQGNPFRQLITSKNSGGTFGESLSMTNVNLPVLAKYTTGYVHDIEFNLDAGLLINLNYQNTYSTNAAFDYEAIYRLDNNGNYIYDNAAVPNPTDLLITRTAYKNLNATELQNKFTAWSEHGAIVALNRAPDNSSGNMNFTTASLGFTIRPSVAIHLSESFEVFLGAYYNYQGFSNTVSSNYYVTSKPGEYNTLLKSISSMNTQSVGVNIGVRYLFKVGDADHDGIPNRLDLCPDDSGSELLKGCPDSDGDGIIDADDSCPHFAGPITNNGCPLGMEPTRRYSYDEIRRGIDTANRYDRDEYIKITKYKKVRQKHHRQRRHRVRRHRMKKSDEDSVFVLPAPKYQPPIDTPVNLENISDYPIDEPSPRRKKLTDNVVRFEENSSTIKKSSYDLLNANVRLLKNNPKAIFVINGHADNVGDATINNKLSKQRADAVRRYFINKGIAAKRLIIKAHGSQKPVATNRTAAGRAKNRRVEIKLMYNTNY
jgi:outer membrane protein OmpA-like peptidoglycan-associated protein